YLFGFVLAAALIGQVSESRVGARRFLPQIAVMAMGVAVIYACGTLHLAAVLRLGWREALSAGVLPFLGVDAVKALLAATVSTVLLPKRP
ncbi:MAG: biotin transporter BioY, partial [Candidatus Brocadiaceae bacterium]